MSNKLIACLVLAGLIFCTSRNAISAGAGYGSFDLLIINGRIADGTGNPWFYGDIAIKNGRIAEIGSIAPDGAESVIDARGKVVAPGFIDVHGHLEGNIVKMPKAENYLQMGVTSVITGNCGFSAIPLGAWFAGLEKQGISINVGSLAGHNDIRRKGMNGDIDRAPTVDELGRMRDITAQAMRHGAVGFSTGLEYVPGNYAKTDEIVEPAKVSAKSGGIYTTHMCDEGIAVEQAIAESLKVGELEVVRSNPHFKISPRIGGEPVTRRSG